jgi:alpha-tubulin suppressor-like RCC1 family protein
MKRFTKTSYVIIGMITIMFLITSTIPAVGATLEILPVMRKPLATELCVSYFIMADGGLYSCGENSYGQLGVVTNISKSVPVKILDDAVFVDSKYNKTYAITGNGNLYVWGSNDTVEKRITADRKLKPRKIMGNVSSISASIQRCVFVTRNGDLYELDDNDKTKKIMSGVRSASAGYSFIAAVKMDGSLWTWGDNTFNGSLGNGTTEPGLVPKQILNDVKSVSCGDEHTLALKNDGTLWAWGSGGNGQLGYGELVSSYDPAEVPWGNDRYTPTKIMEDVRYIDTCEDGSLAIKNDGSL